MKKGFTLIELLVSIAIIGLLASVVFAWLNSSRARGKDSSAKASMSSMRNEANIVMTTTGTYPSDLCNTSTGAFARLLTAVDNQIPGTPSCSLADSNQRWVVTATLNSGTLFCVDSTGFAGTGSASNGTCTSGSSS